MSDSVFDGLVEVIETVVKSVDTVAVSVLSFCVLVVVGKVSLLVVRVKVDDFCEALSASNSDRRPPTALLFQRDSHTTK